MINIADKLHAATEEGILAEANEIKDTKLNLTQEEFNGLVNKKIKKLKKMVRAAL